MEDFRRIMVDNLEITDEVVATTKECYEILRKHRDEAMALLEAVSRCYIEFCDKHNIEREVGMMMLHAEHLLYLADIDLDFILPLDEED